MYRFLLSEMIKANISVAKLAQEVGISEKTLRNKINEVTAFTWPEALTIRDIVNSSIGMEVMFQTDGNNNVVRKRQSQ